jgi:predicted nucleotidyltransferase
MHAPHSDIDFVVYGTDNFRRVESAIERLANSAQLNYIVGNRLDAARKFQGRYKGKIYMYNATRQFDEVTTKFGQYKYTPLAQVRFQATVTSDRETMYRPATYKISGYKPQDPESELPIDKIPIQVVSNIGCYRNVAKQGSEIKVAGKLEKVESTSGNEVFYQVVVGTATSEEEYIWPVTI